MNDDDNKPAVRITLIVHSGLTTYVDKVLKCFHILVLRGYWVLTESRIPLKPVLGDIRIIALSISSHEQTQ